MKRRYFGADGVPGRVPVRYSGAEPQIQLRLEGGDAAQVRSGSGRLAAAARMDLPGD